MKKAGYCLIILTLVFSGFIGGFLFGRNYGATDIRMTGEVSSAIPEGNTVDVAFDPEKTSVTGAKVNINAASVEELSALPGIGNVLAQRIVDYRSESGPFRKIDDLMNVTGIGEKKIDTIKQYITIGGSK